MSAPQSGLEGDLCRLDLAEGLQGAAEDQMRVRRGRHPRHREDEHRKIDTGLERAAKFQSNPSELKRAKRHTGVATRNRSTTGCGKVVEFQPLRSDDIIISQIGEVAAVPRFDGEGGDWPASFKPPLGSEVLRRIRLNSLQKIETLVADLSHKRLVDE